MTLLHLFNLGGPDLIIILLIVLFLFGAKKLPWLFRGMEEAIRQFMEARRRWTGGEAEPTEERESPVAIINRFLVPIAIAIFLMACGVWFFGNGR